LFYLKGYNATEEIQRASNYPNVRLFTAALRQSDDPLYDLAGIEENWSPASESKQAVTWFGLRSAFLVYPWWWST